MIVVPSQGPKELMEGRSEEEGEEEEESTVRAIEAVAAWTVGPADDGELRQMGDGRGRRNCLSARWRVTPADRRDNSEGWFVIRHEVGGGGEERPESWKDGRPQRWWGEGRETWRES